MFYSHEILTSGQYGVSTIWLVATVGKATQKRVTKKAIQDVNVPKACETILDPGAPLALRLQGSLLYGVSRVFAHQCGYVLSDAEKTQSDMMTFFRVMQTSELDPRAGKTKRHNIILEDDPTFDPMSTLPNLDLLSSNKELVLLQSQASSCKVSQMTPLGAAMQGSSSSGYSPGFPGLELPPSSHSAGSYHIPSDFGRRSASLAKSIQEPELMGHFRPFGQDEIEPFSGVNLDFDDQGNLVGIVEQDDQELPVLPSQAEQASRRRVTTPQQPEADVFHADQDIPFMMGEEPLPDGEAFAVQPELEEAVADNRAARVRKINNMLDLNDRVPRNEFRRWSEEYAENMFAAHKHRQRDTPARGKNNAALLLYGFGLGGVGVFGEIKGVVHPLAQEFSGVALEARLQGLEPEELETKAAPRGRRRKSSELADVEEEQEERRVRPRLDEDAEQGRGQGLELGDQMMLVDDSAPEIGMDRAAALEDRMSSSMMPWSRAGSAVPGSSARAVGSAQKMMPDPSPLHGRSHAIHSIERHSDPLGLDFGSDDFAQLHSQESSLGLDSGGHELQYDSQALGAGLDIASQEFLGYTTERVQEKGRKARGKAANKRWIDFEDLAIPGTHSAAVAAQAFLHVLSLATKNVVSVDQQKQNSEGIGPIYVGIDVPGATNETVKVNE